MSYFQTANNPIVFVEIVYTVGVKTHSHICRLPIQGIGKHAKAEIETLGYRDFTIQRIIAESSKRWVDIAFESNGYRSSIYCLVDTVENVVRRCDIVQQLQKNGFFDATIERVKLCY